MESRGIRRLALALWLAIALLLGQHIAVQHATAHGVDLLATQKQLPAETKCDLCLECAPFSGAMSVAITAVQALPAERPRDASTEIRSAFAAPPAFFLSRAPPPALRA
jgi:hypothetical protein